MQIIEKYIDNHKETDQMVIALGYFDGIHLGHQKLIKRAKKIAETKNLKSAVFTFKSHPLSILAPERVMCIRDRDKYYSYWSGRYF